MLQSLMNAWMNKWRTRININRTQAIPFAKRNVNPRDRLIVVRKRPIPWLRQVKYFDVSRRLEGLENPYLRMINAEQSGCKLLEASIVQKVTTENSTLVKN